MGRVDLGSVRNVLCRAKFPGPTVQVYVYLVRGLLQRKTDFIPPPPVILLILQGGASVVVYSNYECSSAFCLSLTFCSLYLEWPGGHLLGKNCPHGFLLLLFLFYAV